MAYAAELLQRSAAGLPPPDGSWGLPTPQPSGAAVLAGVGGSDAASAASGGGGGGSSSGSLPELAEPLSSVGTATSSGSSYDSGDDALQQQGWRRGAGLERPRGGGGAPGESSACRLHTYVQPSCPRLPAARALPANLCVCLSPYAYTPARPPALRQGVD